MYVRDQKERLEDIIECCEKIGRYIEGISKKDFLENYLVQDAIARNIEVITEAIDNVKKEIKVRNLQVEWRFLEKYTADITKNYHEIDYAVIFGMCKQYLPEFKEQIEELMDSLDDNGVGLSKVNSGKMGKNKRR